MAMASGRISVPLTADERGALIHIAEIECRDPREQLRFMLRTEAQHRGLIGANETGRQKEVASVELDAHTKDDQESA